MRDEGPSPDDLRRFGDDDDADTAWCPLCGAEVWHGAGRCPRCDADITPTFKRVSADEQRRLNTIIIVMVIIGLLLGSGLFAILYW